MQTRGRFRLHNQTAREMSIEACIYIYTHACSLIMYIPPRHTLLCSSLENNTNPSAIVSIQVNGVDDLSEALAKSPIHLQFEVYINLSVYQNLCV